MTYSAGIQFANKRGSFVEERRVLARAKGRLAPVLSIPLVRQSFCAQVRSVTTMQRPMIANGCYRENKFSYCLAVVE